MHFAYISLSLFQDYSRPHSWPVSCTIHYGSQGVKMGTRRGFKVTDAERKVRVGIAVETLADLRRKTIEKFKLDMAESEISFQTRDGLFIENDLDFEKLKPQSLLIWVRRGERAETDAEILYRTIREVNMDFLTTGEKVQEFFTEQMKTKVYKLAEVLKELEDSKARLSTKEEDAEWFKGIDSRSKTKEEYMFRRSQDRIRTYYYKTKDDLLKNNRSRLPQEGLRLLLDHLLARLKSAAYYGSYFDRTTRKESICDRTGTFSCQGRWDREDCAYTAGHTINPYKSREERIVFQTWNLDHRIERSRSIVPGIIHALELSASGEAKVDLDLVFEDIFTLNNLKLVHIVCHDKGAHAKLDPERYVKYV